MTSPRVACVAGARPNFVKIAPVERALAERGADTQLVHTGQHYDPALTDTFFDELGIPRPDHELEVGSGTHAEQTARVMERFERLLGSLNADVVVVVGDVNSTLAAALVTAKGGPLLAHVEAGLRSRDWSMPEEVNRVVTDRVSDYLFAPSSEAVENLAAEGYRPDQIHLVGNVMVDSLLANLERARDRPVLRELGLESGHYGFVTLHRPANVDDPGRLRSILGALGEVALRCPLVLAAHPRTRARMEGLPIPDSVRVIPPASYLDSIALQAGAALVLTDSGGMQEETTALGVPCLTLRENTERAITISEGTNRLVGTDPEAIVACSTEVLEHGVEPRCPSLWDGHAADRIAEVILGGGGPEGHPRPTDL